MFENIILPTWFWVRVMRRVSYKKHELLSLNEHSSSPRFVRWGPCNSSVFFFVFFYFRGGGFFVFLARPWVHTVVVVGLSCSSVVCSALLLLRSTSCAQFDYRIIHSCLTSSVVSEVYLRNIWNCWTGYTI